MFCFVTGKKDQHICSITTWLNISKNKKDNWFDDVCLLKYLSEKLFLIHVRFNHDLESIYFLKNAE